MARSKKEMEEAAPETVEQSAEATPEQLGVVEDTQDTPEEDNDPFEEDGVSVPADTDPKLETLSVLADRHRLATWEQAGILRLMGWADDKKVTAEEYEAALETLRRRRIGGGRRG